jgi:hypothetical protein
MSWLFFGCYCNCIYIMHKHKTTTPGPAQTSAQGAAQTTTQGSAQVQTVLTRGSQAASTSQA